MQPERWEPSDLRRRTRCLHCASHWASKIAQVRAHAASALGNIGVAGEETVAALATALKDPMNTSVARPLRRWESWDLPPKPP